MNDLFLFSRATKRDPEVELWFENQTGGLARISKCWFEAIRECGEDVNELVHDGRPTACVNDAAFAYVDSFKTHVNVGFFRGAELHDPSSLLEGTGKLMRHIKI